MLSGVLVRWPPSTVREAMLSSGGPTVAVAPGTPGMLWQLGQPYLVIAALPRSGSPPVSVIADVRTSSRGAAQAASAVNTKIRTAASARMMPPNRFGAPEHDAALRFAQPRCEQRQPEDHEDDASRNPHQQARKLLIGQRVDPPERGLAGVVAVPHRWRYREQRAQGAAVHAGQEHVQHAEPVPDPSVAAVHHAPPEERRGEQEREMLEGVDARVAQRCLVQDRKMPDPQRDR